MKQLKILILFLGICASILAQDKPPVTSESQKAESVKKAEQILRQAKDAVSKKTKIANVKSFSFITKSSQQLSFAERKIEGMVEEEFNLILPDKIRHKSSGNYSTNQSEIMEILNGEKFSLKIDTFVDGKIVNTDFGAVIGKKNRISDLKRETFLLVFPITLDASWYVPLEFNYVGIAESKDGKAEIIEAVSPGKTKYRLFFDTETHLLLLMTQSWTGKDNKQNETKYFFSNYQEKDGLLIATKIITERNDEVVEEKEIKDLKVNPTFKPAWFDIKEK